MFLSDQVEEIEAYLRANDLFIDHEKVSHFHSIVQFFNAISFVIDILATVIYSHIRSADLYFSSLQPHKDNTYSAYLELDLDIVEPCVSGPKR